MDHQVEHYVHVEAAGTELAKAMNLEEKRFGDHVFQREDGGIESLQMSYLQDFFVACRGFDQFARGGGIAGDRFFNQDVEAELDQAASDLSVGNCRGGDNGGVSITREIFQRREYRATERGAALTVKVEDARQIGLGAFSNDTNVIPAERAGSNYCDTGFGHLGKRLTRLMESMRTADFIATCAREYWRF